MYVHINSRMYFKIHTFTWFLLTVRRVSTEENSGKNEIACICGSILNSFDSEVWFSYVGKILNFNVVFYFYFLEYYLKLSHKFLVLLRFRIRYVTHSSKCRNICQSYTLKGLKYLIFYSQLFFCELFKALSGGSSA